MFSIKYFCFFFQSSLFINMSLYTFSDLSSINPFPFPSSSRIFSHPPSPFIKLRRNLIQGFTKFKSSSFFCLSFGPSFSMSFSFSFCLCSSPSSSSTSASLPYQCILEDRISWSWVFPLIDWLAFQSVLRWQRLIKAKILTKVSLDSLFLYSKWG